MPTYLDAVVIGILLWPPLYGIWRGLRLLLVSWPMRWWSAFMGASILPSLALLFVALAMGLATEVHALIALPAIRAGLILMTFVILLIILGRISDRVRAGIGDNFIGGAERILGGVFGAAFGLLLVAWLTVPTFLFYEMMRPNPQEEHPAWLRDSISMPYIKSAAERTKAVFSSYIPQRSQ